MLFRKARWIFISLGILAFLLSACVQEATQAPVQAPAAEEVQATDTPPPVPTDTPVPEAEDEAMDEPAEPEGQQEEAPAPEAEDEAMDEPAEQEAMTAQDQHDQGQIVFEESCTGCHGPEGAAPRLEAAKLAEDFDTVQSLFAFISENMPRNAPGSLSTEQYWNVTAFLVHDRGLVSSDQQVGPENAETISLEAGQ